MIITPQKASAHHEEDFPSQVAAVCAYLERGMPREALAELDAIAPAHRHDWRVQVLRVSISMDLGDWEAMCGAALRLAVTCPGEPRWPLYVAYATRRLESLEQAKAVLLKAARRFPNESGIQYNLACFTAKLGELPAAGRYLRAAFRLNAQWRETARHEPGLAPLWGTLEETKPGPFNQGK